MKGTCLCGAIEVTAQNHHEAGLCHCSTCRRCDLPPSVGPMGF
ncbi:GFA family protein [Burkholderia contaminans]